MKRLCLCVIFTLVMASTSYASALSEADIASIGDTYYENPFLQKDGSMPEIDCGVAAPTPGQKITVDYNKATLVHYIDRFDQLQGSLLPQIKSLEEYFVPVYNELGERVSTVCIRWQDEQWHAPYAYLDGMNISTLDALDYLDTAELTAIDFSAFSAKYIYNNEFFTKAIFLYHDEAEYLYPLTTPPEIEAYRLYTPEEYLSLLREYHGELLLASEGDGGGGMVPGEAETGISPGTLALSLIIAAIVIAITAYCILYRKKNTA